MPDDIEVRFTVQTPGDPEELKLRCLANEARGLPEAVELKTCVIVGSGPSARHSASLEAMKRANWHNIPIVACNGALQVLIEHGIHPAFWVCCDPQEDQVMRFLEGFELPSRTCYLLCNKSPPALFDKLAKQYVRIWRIDELIPTPNKLRVPTAVSITLVAQNLMRFMGYHHFEMYGWDCCYLDGEHHASNQPDVSDRMDYQIQHADGSIFQEFQTSGSWLAEINDAQKQGHNYNTMGYSMSVGGPGAVATTLRAAGHIK